MKTGIHTEVPQTDGVGLLASLKSVLSQEMLCVRWKRHKSQYIIKIIKLSLLLTNKYEHV